MGKRGDLGDFPIVATEIDDVDPMESVGNCGVRDTFVADGFGDGGAIKLSSRNEKSRPLSWSNCHRNGGKKNRECTSTAMSLRV